MNKIMLQVCLGGRCVAGACLCVCVCACVSSCGGLAGHSEGAQKQLESKLEDKHAHRYLSGTETVASAWT